MILLLIKLQQRKQQLKTEVYLFWGGEGGLKQIKEKGNNNEMEGAKELSMVPTKSVEQLNLHLNNNGHVTKVHWLFQIKDSQ